MYPGTPLFLYSLSLPPPSLSLHPLSLVIKSHVSPSNTHRLRRNGGHVSRTLIRRLLYKADSNPNLTNMVTQQDFLKTLQQKLKKKATAGDIIAAMATIRDRLTAASNLRVVMATDVHSLPHPSPVQPWDKFLPSQER